MANVTKRCAFGAAAILVVTGCTTESSSSGCATASGFGGGGTSELGEGHFTYKDKGSKNAGAEVPTALGTGAEFALRFERFSATPDSAPVTLRSASNAKLTATGPSDAASETAFAAHGTGIVAVLALSGTAQPQVIDLVHLRILAPTKIRIDSPYGLLDYQKEDLKQGTLTVETGSASTFVAEVSGEVDAEGGPLGDAPVGSPVVLGGIVPSWRSSDDQVVALTPRSDGSVDAAAVRKGSADVTVSAGTLSKVVHVVVEGVADGN